MHKSCEAAIRIFVRLVLTGAFFSAGAAQARGPEPLVNYENVRAVTGSGQPTNVESVRTAAMVAARSGRWTVTQAADGKALQASLSWDNNRHTIVVDIVPAETHYSIRYASSINMKYSARDGVAVIHPFYNHRVSELAQSIRTVLLTY